MKELLRSYKIFTAQKMMKQYLKGIIIMLAEALAITVIEVLFSGSLNFLSGFIFGAVIVVTPMIGSFILNSIYSYNMPITAGYRYFHSISDSTAHFRRAIIAGNLFGLGIIALAGVSSLIIDMFVIHQQILLVSGASLGLLMLGGANFMGYVRSNVVRVLMIAPLCALGGFCMGFLDSSSEGEEEILGVPPVVQIAVIAISAAVFAAGFIYTLKVCGKKWGEAE